MLPGFWQYIQISSEMLYRVANVFRGIQVKFAQLKNVLCALCNCVHKQEMDSKTWTKSTVSRTRTEPGKAVLIYYMGESRFISQRSCSCFLIRKIKIRIFSPSTLGRVGNKLKPVLSGYILSSPRVVTNICQYQQICSVVHLPYLCCYHNLQLIVRDGVMLRSPYIT